MKKVLLGAAVLCSALYLGNILSAEADEAFTFEKEAAQSDGDTVVFGAAQTPDGGENEMLLEQNPEEGNPLGDPIVAPHNDAGTPVSPESTTASENKPVSENKKPASIEPVVQSSTQGVLKPWEEPLPQPSNKIENELYQSGNDIIDVQAYPIDDVSTVTEPNIQPTIVTQ